MLLAKDFQDIDAWIRGVVDYLLICFDPCISMNRHHIRWYGNNFNVGVRIVGRVWLLRILVVVRLREYQWCWVVGYLLYRNIGIVRLLNSRLNM